MLLVLLLLLLKRKNNGKRNNLSHVYGITDLDQLYSVWWWFDTRLIFVLQKWSEITKNNLLATFLILNSHDMRLALVGREY